MPREGLGLANPIASRETISAPAGAPREVNTALAAQRVREPTQRAPAAAEEAPQPKSRVPQFSDDPLKATAFVFSEAALAFGGAPTNLQGLLELESEDKRLAQAKAFQDESLKLRQAGAFFGAVKTGVDILEKTPSEQHEGIINNLERTVQMPGLGDMLRAVSDKGRDPKAILGFLEENSAIIPGLAALVRDGVVEPEDAVEMVTGLMSKQAEADIKADQPQTNIAKLQKDRDRATEDGRTADAEQLQGRIDNLRTITGRTPEDVAAAAGQRAGAVSEAKSQQEGKQEAAERGLEIANIGNLLNQTVSLPEGSQGIMGAAAETLGGYIGQADKDAGQAFTKFLTSGATTEELTEFRTKARTAIAANIETVTGEESGRFTEMERRVTEETLKALEPGASKAQITSSIGELLKLKVMLRSFSFLKAGIRPKYDLEPGPALRENTAKFVTDMRQFGMSDDQIKDLFERLQSVQREVGPVFKQ